MKLSIRLKLILFTFCIVLLVGAGIFLYSIYQGRQRALAGFERGSREITTVISETIVNDLYFLDLRSLRLRLESARVNPDIKYAYVTDVDGVILTDGTQENLLRDQKLTGNFSAAMLHSAGWISRLEGELLKVGGPVYAPDGSRMGYLQVGFSLDIVHKRLEGGDKASLYVTTICLGIGVLLAFIFATRFTRPISTAIRAATEIGAGKLDIRLPVGRKDELGLLAQSINQMADGLQRRQAESEQKTQGLQALYTLTDAVNRSLNLEDCMRTALVSTIGVLKVDAGRLYVVDENDGVLRLRAHHAIPVDQLGSMQRYAPGEGIVGKVFTDNRPFVFSDIDADPRYRELARSRWAQQSGYRSSAGLPITIRDRPVGVIYLYGRAVREFTPEDIELLSSVGIQIGVAIERARLFQETEQRARQQEALNAIASATTQLLRRGELLEIVLDKVLEVTGRERVSIRLKDAVTGEVTLAAYRGFSQEEVEELLRRKSHRMSEEVFASGKPVVINDGTVVPGREILLPQSRSVAWIPIKARQEVVGVLGVSAGRPVPFSQREVDLLEAIGNVIGVALVNARLYEETTRRGREAEELARVARSLTETLDMTAVGERIVASVRELFGVSASTLRLLQPDGSLRTLASAGQGFSASSGEDILPTGTGLASVAVAEGRPIWSADVLNEPRIRFTDRMRDYQLRSGDRSIIAVPLRAHEKVIGSLGLADRTGRIYSDREVALLQTFADQGALALESARLFEETKRNLDGIRALHEIDIAISSTLDLHEILKVLLDKIDLFLPYSTATVRLLNKESGLLEPVACRNLDEAEWKAAAWKPGRGPANAVFESRTPLMIHNCLDDPRVKDPGFFRKHHLVSYLGVPMFAREEILGVLSFYTKEEHRFTNEEVEFLTALAGQAAIAIHNSEVYEEMAKLAADLSRSNKVKDEFLSVMSHELRTPLNVVMGYSGMIKDRLLGEINLEQEKALEKVISRARDQLTMISSILQAVQMEAEGVKVESRAVNLREFLDDLSANYTFPLSKELNVVWDYPFDLPVIHTDGEKLKHVLQNLINNAIKFTEKGTVTISVSIKKAAGERQQAIDGRDGTGNRQESFMLTPSASSLAPSWVQFKVADTGIGIAKEHQPMIFERFHQVDSSETRRYGGVGIGLYIVKKFTELLGGKVEVESEPGKGSTFTVTIPGESHQQASKEEPSERAPSR